MFKNDGVTKVDRSLRNDPVIREGVFKSRGPERTCEVFHELPHFRQYFDYKQFTKPVVG